MRAELTNRFPSAVVIGSGPNGLTAAIVLATAGLHTTVIEAQTSVGGGTRSAELTLPGFLHDVCSAVHPLAVSSPAFQAFPLSSHGLNWIQPPIPLAHPFDDGTAAILDRSLDRTCEGLGEDGHAYQRTVGPLSSRWAELMQEVLQPVLHPPHNLGLSIRFGLLAALPASLAARSLFKSHKARALFAGNAAHSVLPLEELGTSAFAWILSAAAHAAGWPIPQGGSQRIADALSSYFQSLGGRIVTGTRVASLEDVREAGVILCDVTPRQFLQLAGDRLPSRYRRKMEKYRYGPGVFKMDWALSGPIPWKAEECSRASTVHIGGTLEEIASSERAVWQGILSERPFVLLTQPSQFDKARAPENRHIAWAYCHVPNGSDADMSRQIESQIERFAPGFRSRILARHCFAASQLERHNPNLVGGDITGGANHIGQLIARPSRLLYRTPVRGVYLCSASTPPGGGVHGMCGWHAAKLALADLES